MASSIVTWAPIANIIADIRDGRTTLLSTNVPTGKMAKFDSKTGFGSLDEDCAPDYLKILSYFDVHKQMPERSKEGITTTQDLLTSGVIANIKQIQEEKNQKIGKQKLEQRAADREKGCPWWWVW